MHARVHLKGETLPKEMRMFRYDLVEACLKAGIPIAKIDCMRPFLEKIWLSFNIKQSSFRNQGGGASGKL